MPRPKRSKVIPSALPRAKPPAVEVDPIEEFSDREGHPSTKRAKKLTLDLLASPQIPATKERREKHALQELMANRDAAMNRLIAVDVPTSETILASTEVLSDEELDSQPLQTARISRGRVTNSSENSTLPAFQSKKTRQSSILGVRGRRGRSRSSSIESELAESSDMVNKPSKDNPIGPLTTDTRRGQRQPSILGRGGPRARSNSAGLEIPTVTPLRTNTSMLDGRRRQRQRSILGTARKQTSPDADHDDSLDLENLVDFAPDGESTPVNNLKSQVMIDIVTDSQPLSSASRKRKASVLEETLTSKPDADTVSDIYSASPAPQLNSLSSPEAEDSTLEPEEAILPLPASQDEAIEATDDASSSLESLSSDLLDPQLSQPEQADEASQYSSSIMAPPRSSSSPEVTPRALPTARAPKRRQQNRRQTTPSYHSADDSLPSSPPSLTYSPNHRFPSKATQASKRQKAIRQEPDPAQLSTAQLQELLPRRRPRVRQEALYSDEDIDMTNLASDDDEITHLNVRAARRVGSSKKQVTRLKSKAKSASAARTYGSKKRSTETDSEDEVIGHGEENDEEGDDNLPANRRAASSTEGSQELEARLGKELKRAKRKFENVDKWELEFEEVTASSSMGDFR